MAFVALYFINCVIDIQFLFIMMQVQDLDKWSNIFYCLIYQLGSFLTEVYKIFRWNILQSVELYIFIITMIITKLVYMGEDHDCTVT